MYKFIVSYWISKRGIINQWICVLNFIHAYIMNSTTQKACRVFMIGIYRLSLIEIKECIVYLFYSSYLNNYILNNAPWLW